jgi:aminoglycoside phosphotransferase (APT) family kinase protein
LSDPSLAGYLGEFLEWARGLDPALPARLEQADLRQGSLIHGDYHPLNVLTDGQSITGVLDWPSSGSADPRVDIGHTAVLLQTGPLPPGPIRPLVRVLRGLFHTAWKRGYEDVGGQARDIGAFMVLAGLSWLRDLEWAADRPGVWDELDARPVREWTERWKREIRFG